MIQIKKLIQGLSFIVFLLSNAISYSWNHDKLNNDFYLGLGKVENHTNKDLIVEIKGRRFSVPRKIIHTAKNPYIPTDIKAKLKLQFGPEYAGEPVYRAYFGYTGLLIKIIDSSTDKELAQLKGTVTYAPSEFKTVAKIFNSAGTIVEQKSDTSEGANAKNAHFVINLVLQDAPNKPLGNSIIDIVPGFGY